MGEPARPRSSTSQPACSSTRCRPAASPTVLAPVRAGHEAERGRFGDAEQVFQPDPDRLLDEGGRRGGDAVVGVLVPPGGQQVGGRGGLEGAPDHEAEVARAGRGDQGRLGGPDQPVDDRVRGLARFGQRTAERGPLASRGRSSDRPSSGLPPGGRSRSAPRCEPASFDARPPAYRSQAGYSMTGWRAAGVPRACAGGRPDPHVGDKGRCQSHAVALVRFALPEFHPRQCQTLTSASRAAVSLRFAPVLALRSLALASTLDPDSEPGDRSSRNRYRSIASRRKRTP